jgi:hypothetical protein
MDCATHCLVGSNFDESQVQEARELYEKPTVNEQWVLVSAKLGKLAPVKPYEVNSGKLFYNCVFTMYQLDIQDRMKLYAMITYNGGTVQKELDNKVTHLLCASSQSVAIKVAALTKNKLTIVTPDYVIECLKNKKLVESEAYHPNLLLSPTQQTSKIITLMPAGNRDEKTTSLVRNQLQQNVRPARPTIQTMQHTPQQINEILQSQIQQQQMQEKAKLRAAAGSSANQMNQSPITSISLGSNEPQPQPQQQQPQQQVVNQITTQKVVQQQILSVNSQQVPMNTNQGNNLQQQQQQVQGTAQNQPQTNTMGPNNQINMQRQISLQQIEANARNQKIQMISQQLQQSTQNQQQLLAQQQQQQFKQFQSNQMGQQGPQQNVQQAGQQQQPQQQQFAQGNIQQQQQGQQGQQNQNQVQQNQQQFAGQQMKQIINPNQAQNQQQFIMNQNAPGGTVKTIGGPQTPGNSSGNYIQIIQQGGQQIMIQQHPEGGQIQQKIIHVSYYKILSRIYVLIN